MQVDSGLPPRAVDWCGTQRQLKATGPGPLDLPPLKNIWYLPNVLAIEGLLPSIGPSALLLSDFLFSSELPGGPLSTDASTEQHIPLNGFWNLLQAASPIGLDPYVMVGLGLHTYSSFRTF